MTSSKIIAKMNRETKEGVIAWETNRASPPSLSGGETLADNVYTVNIKDRRCRLYKYKYKYYHDEDVFSIMDGYRLEFVDLWGNSQWEFPEDRAIFDLYETVRFKTSDIEGFFKDYLEGESDKDDLPF